MPAIKKQVDQIYCWVAFSLPICVSAVVQKSFQELAWRSILILSSHKKSRPGTGTVNKNNKHMMPKMHVNIKWRWQPPQIELRLKIAFV